MTAPAWIKDGTRVVYQVSPGREHAYEGTVDGEPRELGSGTWVVRLRDMEARYRNGQRSTVPAAACSALTPALPQAVTEQVRANFRNREHRARVARDLQANEAWYGLNPIDLAEIYEGAAQRLRAGAEQATRLERERSRREATR